MKPRARRVASTEFRQPCEWHRCSKCDATWASTAGPLVHELTISRVRAGLELVGPEDR